MKLDDDVRVKIEAQAVGRVGHPPQCGRAVGPVAAVQLAEARADQAVLRPGEDPVAGEFVEGHAALERAPFRQEAAAIHGVRAGGAGVFRQQVRQKLRRVLPVAVQQHDDVEALGECVVVAEALVAAVALVVRGLENFQRRAGPLGRHRLLHGAVAGAVIDDKHLGELAADPVRDAPQHLVDVALGVVTNDEDGDAILRESLDGETAGLVRTGAGDRHPEKLVYFFRLTTREWWAGPVPARKSGPGGSMGPMGRRQKPSKRLS